MQLSKRFMDAFAYAERVHSDQLRKGTSVPYLSHLMAVCSIALDHGADEDEAVASLLHDAVEDQGGDDRRAEIRALFGERVLEIVDQCSEKTIIPKPPWRERKEAYISHLRTAAHSAMLVSASDKIHNLRNITADYTEIGEAVWDRFNAGKDETLWYYKSLKEVFSSREDLPLALRVELTRLVEALEGLNPTAHS